MAPGAVCTGFDAVYRAPYQPAGRKDLLHRSIYKFPGRISAAPTAATTTHRRRGVGVNEVRYRNAHMASAMRLPPGTKSAIAACGPSSRTLVARRLRPLARPAGDPRGRTAPDSAALEVRPTARVKRGINSPHANRRPRSISVTSPRAPREPMANAVAPCARSSRSS